MIETFEEIVDSLDAFYEKSKDPEIKGVGDVLLHHMILFNLFLAFLLQISNNFFKFFQSCTILFSSLLSKVDRMNERLRKYLENIETERSFFLNYAGNYLHVADQRSKLSRSTWEKRLQKLTIEEQKRNFLQKIALLAEIDVVFKKSDNILCAFEVLTVDNLNKHQSDSVNLFKTTVRVLVNFYGTEQVDEFQEKEPMVHGIIDKEEVMKDLPDFLLGFKDAFHCHNKKTNQAVAGLKEKLTKKKKTADKIKKMVEPFIDKNSFTIPIWYCIMVSKHEATVLYPNMMSLLELYLIIPSSMAEVERGFSVMKLRCTRLIASILPSTLDILMRIGLCRDSP